MKNKGFVMMETLVVMTALTIGLISIYSSYSVLLSRARISQSHENVDKVYQTYFISNYIKENETIPDGFTVYNITNAPNNVKFIMENFHIEKLYIFNSSKDFTEFINPSNLDGSSIAFFDMWDDYEPSKYNFVAKFKYGDFPREKIEFASVPLIEEKDEENKSITTNGLVSWLDFVSNTNDSPNKNIVYDLSGNDNNGTLENFDYSASSGWSGDGLSFDGTGNYVFFSPGSYKTLEIVFNYYSNQKINQNPALYYHGLQSSTNFIKIFSSGTSLSLYNQVNSTTNRIVDNFIEYDKFIHLTVVYKNNTFLVYKNGENLTSFVSSGLPQPEGNAYIGINQESDDYGFYGKIKLFRAYDRTLTEDEIKNNYELSK